jgi:hypothetical protein
LIKFLLLVRSLLPGRGDKIIYFFKVFIMNTKGAVEKVVLHPLTPQGGICNLLYTRKSPLGDLGVEDKKSTFSTAPGQL